MDPSNRHVAGLLEFMGQLLEIQGENTFKVRAYYRSARAVERVRTPVTAMTVEELVAIPGIGKNIAHKILEIAATGSFTELEEIKKKLPGSLIELLRLDGVGPKTIATLRNKLDITSIDDLEKAAEGHRIRALYGFGEKKEREMQRSIERYRSGTGRMTRIEADRIIRQVLPVLGAGSAHVAGSYRRGKSTIGDIDVVTTTPPSGVNRELARISDSLVDMGDRRTSIRLDGRRVDIRFSRPDRLGSMLLYLTGSKEFNIKIREVAIARGYKLNEYGMEERSSGKVLRFEDEDQIFRRLGMDPVPPELREDGGEVELALGHALPLLVKISDIRGDLHVHSSWSDGEHGLEELAALGSLRGYEFILVSDHSASLGIAGGLDSDGLRRQQHEIEVVNRKSDCRLLAGVEVDIMADGKLGLPGTVLGDLDLVIASVHSGFRQDEDTMTRRIISAIASEHVDIIGHPTGRLLGRRPPCQVDLERVIDAAKDGRVALEINASPYRLDLDDEDIRHAVDRGVPLSIGTDAHHRSELEYMALGVMLARRGWCEALDLLNAREADAILEWAS